MSADLDKTPETVSPAAPAVDTVDGVAGARSWDPKRPFSWWQSERGTNAGSAPGRRRARHPLPSVGVERPAKVAQSPLVPRTITTVSAPAASIADPFLDAPNEKFSVYATLAFLFLRFSFLHDFITVHIGFNSYLVTATGLLAYVGLLRSETWRSAAKSKLFWAWVIFTGLLIVDVPLSSWPGGSFAVVEPFVKDNFICLPLLAGLFYNWPRLRLLFLTLAWAGVAVTAITFVNGGYDANGRLTLFFTSTVGNPNDLAAHLIYVSIFMLIAAFSLEQNMVFRLIFLGTTGAALLQILRTGSRGALIGILVGVAVGFLCGSMKFRFTLLFLAPVAAAVLLAVMPQSTLERLSSFTGTGTDEAQQSYSARRYLLQRSIDLTIEHPLFGVGPGQFSSSEGAEAAAEGHHHAHWQETHNTFTEVSSEVGIPALMCVLYAVGGSFLLFWRLTKQAKRNTNLRRFALPAYLLVTGTAAICATIFFVNFGYKLYLIVLTGVGIGIARGIGSMVSADIPSNTSRR